MQLYESDYDNFLDKLKAKRKAKKAEAEQKKTEADKADKTVSEAEGYKKKHLGQKAKDLLDKAGGIEGAQSTIQNVMKYFKGGDTSSDYEMNVGGQGEGDPPQPKGAPEQDGGGAGAGFAGAAELSVSEGSGDGSSSPDRSGRRTEVASAAGWWSDEPLSGADQEDDGGHAEEGWGQALTFFGARSMRLGFRRVLFGLCPSHPERCRPSVDSLFSVLDLRELHGSTNGCLAHRTASVTVALLLCVLVPGIDTKLGNFEFYGRSAPSGEVGGDLIDLAGSEDHWVAYVADVSGHGVAPGVVMGMVKSAARMLLSSGAGSSHLLPRLNEVLYPLKRPDMFVTFCFLAKNGTGLSIGLAGHPAILHFSARTNGVAQWDCPNMPLGILPSGDFANSELRADPGDVFALYTDGLLEAANAAGEEFGIARLQGVLQNHGTEPLEAICRAVEESVARHGAQFDDQSLLLIRRT